MSGRYVEDDDDEDSWFESKKMKSNGGKKMCSKKNFNNDDSASDSSNSSDSEEDLSPNKCEKTSQKQIKESYVGKISFGKDTIKVNSVTVDYDFDYANNSVCKFGLSINEKLVFTNNALVGQMNNLIKEQINEILENIKVKTYEKYLTMPVYSEDSCVICCEETPDCVLYVCGHNCCHLQCVENKLSKCPLCRTPVSAYVKAKYVLKN